MNENTLIIPDGTLTIPKQEYKNCDFQKVVFPESLQLIEDEAFYGCENLKFIKLPKGLKKIGTAAFKDCKMIQEIFIPGGVKEIGEEAFTHFALIYCEDWIRPDGWYYEFQDLSEDIDCDDVDEEQDILDMDMDETLFHHNARTWCGNYSYNLSFDDYIAGNKDYEYNPEHKVIWGRNGRYIYENQLGLSFDIFTYLKDSGEDQLRTGRIANLNPLMKEAQEQLKDKLNTYCKDDDIINTIKLYMDVLLKPLMQKGHEEEWLFYTWGLYHYIFQLSQLDVYKHKLKNWPRPLTIEKSKWAELLVKIRSEWKSIIEVLEQVDISNTNLNLLLLQYYDKKDTSIESQIFEAYDKKFFGNGRHLDENAARAAEQYNNEANYYIGEKELWERDYYEAGKLFEQAALCGNANGQYNYALTIMMGEFPKKTPIEACYWYWKAACSGQTKAMVNLAESYMKGTGVLKDDKKMLYWYARAAHELDSLGLYNLGKNLTQGTVIHGKTRLGEKFIRYSETLDHGKVLTEDAIQIIIESTEELLLELKG